MLALTTAAAVDEFFPVVPSESPVVTAVTLTAGAVSHALSFFS